MPVFKVSNHRILYHLFVLFLAGCVNGIQGQSLDARSPSPIRTNEVVGRIGARDIGDARLTDHFYAFTGTPGDLLITIETRNLNGDIDVFTAGALRPILKLALYAEVNAPVTKSIYLRNREDLILRVEARSPNDDDGTYHINFGGSFEPIAELREEATNEIASAPPVTRKGKRVSSVGARIEAIAPPPLEVAETEAKPSQSSPSDLVDPPPAERSTAKITPAEVRAPEAKAESVELVPTRTRRNTRTRTPARRGRNRGQAEVEAKKPVTEEIPDTEKKTDEARKSDPVAETSDKPTTPAKRGKKSRAAVNQRSEAANSESTQPVGEPATESVSEGRRSKRNPTPSTDSESSASTVLEDLSKTKLIIEMLDGTRIERFMNQIRRVDVESGQIVVTAADGTVERIRLARVVRMSIGQ